MQIVGDTVRVGVDTAGLALGTYQATVTVEAEAEVVGSPVQIPVTLLMAEEVDYRYLPLILR